MNSLIALVFGLCFPRARKPSRNQFDDVGLGVLRGFTRTASRKHSPGLTRNGFSRGTANHYAGGDADKCCELSMATCSRAYDHILTGNCLRRAGSYCGVGCPAPKLY